jgi:hypothetical protein
MTNNEFEIARIVAPITQNIAADAGMTGTEWAIMHDVVMINVMSYGGTR